MIEPILHSCLLISTHAPPPHVYVYTLIHFFLKKNEVKGLQIFDDLRAPFISTILTKTSKNIL